jgi:hypothetical protein
MPSVPKSITLDQQVEALKAFFGVLGINPNAAYFPLIVTQDQIMLPMVPEGGVTLDRPEAIRAHNYHPQGDEHGEFSCMVTIEVLDR